MTPIDNAILTEMLDNALSDIKYMRQERNHLREDLAEAKEEVYKLNDYVIELESGLVDAEQKIERYKEALRISIRETSDLEDQLSLYQENCECSQ